MKRLSFLLGVAPAALIGLGPLSAPAHPAAPASEAVLVYCPVDIDTSGCEQIVRLLAEAGISSVDRGYDGTGGTLDLAHVDLSRYAVLVVPSLADDPDRRPYDRLRQPAVVGNLRAALQGRVAVWSGTPDQGTVHEDGRRELLAKLVRWAAATYYESQATGIVVLQDLSDQAPYDWLPPLTDLRVTAASDFSVHDQAFALNAAGAEIIEIAGQPLAFPAMATFGLLAGTDASDGEASATGTSLDGPIVLITREAGNFALLGSSDLEITSILAPVDPVAVQTPVAVSGTFSTADPTLAHVAEVHWGDGSSSMAVVEVDGAFSTGSFIASRTYVTPGVYTVRVELSTDQGFTTREHEYVTVFDPEGQHVSGNGAIESPPGAFLADPSLAGPATFGFQSRYREGSSVPSGNARFRFRIADLRFVSTEQEWLVVSGARAQFKGSGTINGAGDFGYLLTAIDGERPGGGGADAFRIKIWDRDLELVVYDNMPGEDDDADPSTTLTRGKITIHTSGRNSGPTIIITSPADGLVVEAGTAIDFNATADDAEEGDLSGSIAWSSNLDGALHTGSTFTRTNLSVGLHTITASVTDAGGLTGYAEITVEVLPGEGSDSAPAKLAFAQQPTTAAAGETLTPAVSVRIEDALGNLVTGSTAEVTLAIGNNPAAGTLSGTLTRSAVGGVATFDDLSIDEVGMGYTLQASSTGLDPATSDPFDIVSPPSLAVSSIEISTFSSGLITVTLPQPASEGGQEVVLSSDDPTVSVESPVVVPEGESAAEGLVESGATIGIATITASSEGFADGAGAVTVLARGMSLVLDPLVGVGRTNEASVVLDEPAPTGGVSVALSSSAPLIVSVDPDMVYIASGETSADFTITGEAEGVAIITASAEGYADATIEAGGTNTTVSIGTIPVLAPGESRSLPISLSEPAPPGGLTIYLESTDPAVATVESSVTVAGGAQLPTTNPQVTGMAAGTAVIHANAEGFAPDARTATVELIVLAVSPSPLNLVEGWDRSVTLSLSRPAPVGGLDVELTSMDPAVFAVPGTVAVPEGQTSATFSATGVQAGNSTLLVEATGATGVSVPVSVSVAPDITLFDVDVGEDLQTQAHVSLSVVPPEPVNLTLTVASGSAALISTSRTEVGSTSITFTGVANTSGQPFYVQGLEEGATTTLTASAPGYNDRVVTVTVHASGFHFETGSFSTTTFSGNSTITLSAWRLQANGNLSARQELRPGLSVEIPVTSSDPSVGVITTSPVLFTGGEGALRSTAFDPLTAGATTIEMAYPANFTPPSNGRTSITATVTEG